MPIGRLAIVFTVLLFLASPMVRAIPSRQLPAGISSVEVDGQPIDAATSPTANSETPTISGKSDLGVQTIELSVSNGAPITFTDEVDAKGKFRAEVPQPLAPGPYSLTIAGLAIGTFTVPDGATDRSPRQPGPLLDIARVVPYPVDFDGTIPGLGFLDGRFYTLPEEAQRTVTNGDAEDEGQTERALAEAGWLQRYESRLAAPDSDNPGLFAAQSSSFVVEYATRADAEAAFGALVDSEAIAAETAIGDQSSLTLLTGTTPDTGTEYQAARLTFRLETMLVVIVYADLRDQQPDLALVQSIGQRVAERAAVVAQRQTTSLGTMVLRLDPEPATGRVVRRDLYDVRAATLTPLYNEDDATAQGRVELFTGTVDAFASTTAGTVEDRGSRPRTKSKETTAVPEPTSVISIEGESEDATTIAAATPAVAGQPVAAPETAQVFMMSSLFAFPGDGEAESWLSDQVARVRSSAASSDTYTEEKDAPSFGDGSAVFATHRPTGDGAKVSDGFRLYSQVGPITTVLEITSTATLRLDTAAKLMEFQVSCIQQGACTGLVSLRGSLFSADDEPVLQQRTPLPTRERTPTTAETPTPPNAAEPPPIVITEPTREVVEEAPPPAEPTQPPQEETPPPEEPTPPAEEATPPPEELTPPPVEEGTPPPADEATPPPSAEGTPPAEETPPPAEETPPPAQETPPPAEETPPPAEEPTAVPTEPPAAGEPTAVPTPAPDVEPEPTAEPDKGDRNNDGNNRDRDRRRDRDKDKKS